MSTTPLSLQTLSEEEITSLNAVDLKRLLSSHNVNYEGCIERREFVDLAIATKRALPPPEPALVPYFGKQEKEKIDYYALLEVPKTATMQEITRAYYRLARDNHPDKNPNNPFAEEKFKQISEAYQVLSDPEKRKRYDDFGMAGVSEEHLDPKELFRMLFGGKKFDGIFGQLSIFDMDLTNGNQTGTEQAWEQKQQENIKKLVHQLLIKVEPFVQGLKTQFSQMVETEAKELVEVPGGQELLQLVGYVYLQEGKQHLDTFLGIPAFFSRVAEKGHMVKLAMDTMKHMVKMQAAQMKIEKDMQNTPLDENTQITPEMALLLQEGLKTIWSIGKIEIDQILRRVCETTLQDPLVPKPVRKARAKALKTMGEIFEKVAKHSLLTNANSNPFQQGPFALFEQQQQNQPRS